MGAFAIRVKAEGEDGTRPTLALGMEYEGRTAVRATEHTSIGPHILGQGPKATSSLDEWMHCHNLTEIVW